MSGKDSDTFSVCHSARLANPSTRSIQEVNHGTAQWSAEIADEEFGPFPWTRVQALMWEQRKDQFYDVRGYGGVSSAFLEELGVPQVEYRVPNVFALEDHAK